MNRTAPLSRKDAKPATPALSLAEIAYRRLEEAIVTLELIPGDTLNEAHLIDLVGVGRTPVREALIRLAQQRMVQILPRKGIIVTAINALDVLAALDVRTALERLIAEGAALRASAEERIMLVTQARAMRAAADAGDLQAYMRCDKELDAIVTQAARSPYAARALEPLQALIRRAWYFYERDRDLDAAAAGHLDFARAIALGDKAGALAASDALMNHLREGFLARVSES